ncbi:MAG: AAA family ATPase [Candidatus Schekmanbacteria bacterium]|nr:AAA family ATPase [Candidatus Schekmanbacteria bacterium]
MIGRIVGPYRLLSSLGSGGMGVVHLAEDMQTGERVALKTVLRPQVWVLACMRREIRALARLRHPGIVRVIAEGVHEGMPWYAMQLLTGESLRSWMSHRAAVTFSLRVTADAEPATAAGAPPAEGHDSASWWTQSLAPSVSAALPPAAAAAAAAGVSPLLATLAAEELAKALSMVRSLCEPLAYMHGEGLVHRDLKPDNILLVSGDGGGDGGGGAEATLPVPQPVIVDFGLSGTVRAEHYREEIASDQRVAGTVPYMAPERIRGDTADARADLYALGCILYELLTGRPPFAGTDVTEVLRAHLWDDPLPPSALVGGIRRELDELVLSLLRKEPRDRLGYADLLGAALEELGARHPPPADEPQPRPYLYRPALVGRDDELAQFQRLLDGLAAGAGTVLLIGGESGAGKTRLASELARRATEHGDLVITGSCSLAAPIALEPFRGVLRFIADSCRAHGEAVADRLLGPRGPVLAVIDPSLRELAGQRRYPPPADLPRGAAHLRLLADLAKSVSTLCEKQSLVLLIDDLQWADPLSLDLLAFLLRGGYVAKNALSIVATYRADGEASADIRGLMEREDVAKIRLGGLSEQAIAQVAADMMAVRTAPAPLGRYLVRQSSGNPFFVAEVLQLAVEERLLQRTRSGAWALAAQPGGGDASAYEALPVPSSLQALVEHRLAALEPLCLRLVSALAVLDGACPESSVRCVGGFPAGVDVGAALGELIRRRVVKQDPDGTLSLVHEVFRRVAYERLDGALRVQMHRSAALVLGATGGPGPGQTRIGKSSEIGRHWEAAGEPSLAARSFLEAAREMLAGSLYEEAVRHGTSSLRLEESAEASLVVGRALAGLARFEAALEITERAIATSAPGTLEWIDAQLLAADVALRQGKFAESLYRAEAVLAAPVGGAERAEALRRQGAALLAQGQSDAGRETLEQALRVLDEGAAAGEEPAAGSPRDRERVRILINLGNAHQMRGAFREACAGHEQARQLAERIGDRWGVAAAQANIGNAHLTMGDCMTAARHYEDSLAIWRELGDRWSIAALTDNLGILDRDCYRNAAALRRFAESLALRQEIGDEIGVGVTYLNMGLVRMHAGALDEARDLCARAIAIYRHVGARDRVVFGLSALGEVLVELARDADAQQAIDEAVETAERGGMVASRAAALTLRARMLSAQQRHDEAEAVLTEVIATSRACDAALTAAAALAARARCRLDRDPEAAWGDAEQARLLYAAGGHAQGGASVDVLLARLHALAGDEATARTLLGVGLAILAPQTEFRLYLQAREDEAAALTALGDARATDVLRFGAQLAREHGAAAALRRFARLLAVPAPRAAPVSETGTAAP